MVFAIVGFQFYVVSNDIREHEILFHVVSNDLREHEVLFDV